MSLDCVKAWVRLGLDAATFMSWILGFKNREQGCKHLFVVYEGCTAIAGRSVRQPTVRVGRSGVGVGGQGEPISSVIRPEVLGEPDNRFKA